MLQNIRSNIQGTLAKVIIGLIVVSFALFGIESILLGGGQSGVAEVNGEAITAFEVQQTVNLQRRQLLSMLGDDADPSLLDDDRLTGQAIETLIQRELLVQAAGDLGLMTAEQTIGAVVGDMEQFQVAGSFDQDLFRSVLATAGFTPALFKESLREDLVTNQLRAGLAASDFATPAELALQARIAGEQRDLRYLAIPVDRFDKTDTVEAEAVAAWYDDHPERFMTPESVDVSYIELTLEDFEEPVSEETLREEFDLTRDSFDVPTEARVAHILLIQSDDESDAAYAARIAEAQAAATGDEDFAAVAGRLSDDIGSASVGGDLGYTAGDTFPAAMEQAISALAVNAVSAPVETDAGTHIIKILDRREGKAVSFEEVRGQLAQRLRESAARDELLRIVEDLRDRAFNAEDLSAPAEALGLTVERAEGIPREGAEGRFADPRVQSALFSEEVLVERHNSPVLELAPQRYLVLHADAHHLPERQPLDAVRDEIATRIAAERARAAALEEGERLLAALAGGERLDALASAGEYEWQVELGATRSANALPTALGRRVFTLPPPEGEAPVRELVSSPAGDIFLVELTRVTPGSLENLPAQRENQLRRSIAGEYGSIIIGAYEGALRASAEVEVY
ncbi:SurA N-terminal domain-containing protein [Pseudohaliea rubra]|uniref:Periplasmic chaperone PpiD n=1 Tax=Pseudohaliea rubra DSM 19751 TaxID=1265313 RepID=A0A095VQD6_9GAMM|nr:SurA N-terminal domain-containing protein [Pseudohaliea rubra]KGE03570.1 Peptidyl-prolyl cis-trans isomerase ppiD [Pseudohaliea rubra DSM 19751]